MTAKFKAYRLQTCYERVGSGGLLPPLGNKHCDLHVTALTKPVHGQLDPITREHLLTSMAETKTLSRMIPRRKQQFTAVI